MSLKNHRNQNSMITKGNFYKIILACFSVIVFTLMSLSCSKRKKVDWWRIFFLDSYLSIYHVSPSLSLTNIIEHKPDHNKKKFILVHGWIRTDRETDPSPSESEQQDRIRNYWSLFFYSSEFQDIINKGYEIYTVDYNTSFGIDINGNLLRNRINDHFGSENKTLVYFGHSMGGLITKWSLLDSNPQNLNLVFTAGTPFHGSPWASKSFQKNRGPIGDLAAYFTSTMGGRDLAWDNYDGNVSGSSNAKLTRLNLFTELDSRFIVYYGSCSNLATPTCTGNDHTLDAACTLLGLTFSPSDCISPKASAISFGNVQMTQVDLGALNHAEIALEVSSQRADLLTRLPL